MASKSTQRLPSDAPAPVAAKPREGRQTLNGVLLLVPILALLALLGVALAVAGIFSIGFWPALGRTALATVGALLLALAVAIFRGK